MLEYNHFVTRRFGTASNAYVCGPKICASVWSHRAPDRYRTSHLRDALKEAPMSEMLHDLAESLEQSWALMVAIGRRTAGHPGITRAAYGAGEQLAMLAVADFATAQGLAVSWDAFGNQHVVLPGEDTDAPAVVVGSHLDSVPNGGNFDGLAGVAAGLAALLAVHRSGTRPRRTLRLVALRGEESPWFGTAYLGSRLLLGRSSFTEIGALVRFDTGDTLAHHLAALGPMQPVAPPLDASTAACYFELHIEQGPLLEGADVPLGIATALRGNVRFPVARCLGAYGHSAALPRAFRQDAVLAVSELALGLDAHWQQRVTAGDDNLVVTIGKFSTDPAQHAMTKVAGEVTFSINIGATDPARMAEAQQVLDGLIERISRERRVRFELGGAVGTAPIPLDPALIAAVESGAAAIGAGFIRMPTVGHDAAMFAQAGIPACVLLVRNANGSHNPHETMAQADFAIAGRVLAMALLERAA